MRRLSDFEPLCLAEQKLLEECVNPARITFGDGEIPAEATPDTLLRAGLLRLLLVASDSPLTEKGLRLRGAWIEGTLDLQGIVSAQDLSLAQCHVASGIEMVNARLGGLYVSGCVLNGLAADNARFDGAVFLRDGTHVAGEVSLAGARIAGDLQLVDIVLSASGQDALFAPSLVVEGSLFLGNYPYSNGISTLGATGALFLSSAQIAHDVFVSHCAISPNREIGHEPVFNATEEHGADIALSLARARTGGILYFRDNQISGGIVNLAGAEVTRLNDEPTGPGASYPVRLDGFRYHDFARHADTTVQARLDWVERRPRDTPFTAQPYEQLARVLREMGHREDARKVLMHKEARIRAEARSALDSAFARWLSALWDGFLKVSVGYGYRAARVLMLALVMIVALGIFFDLTWRAGDMTPNAAPILVSRDWIAATESHPDNPGAFWASPNQAGQDWETFNGFAYAADLVIPIVSLGQESAWAPSTSRSDLGRVGWWLRWVAKVMGWVITALGAAAVTGAVRQE